MNGYDPNTAPGARHRFEALYGRYYSRVLAYGLRRVEPEIAHDAVADTFLVAWRRLDSVPDDALPWLLAVMRKTLRTHRRSAERQRSLLSEIKVRDATRSPDETGLAADAAAEFRAVIEALQRLPDADQELLKLIVWDGLSTKDAAAVVGVTHVAARVRLHRAKRRLAAELELDEELDQRPRRAQFRQIPEEIG